MVPTLLLCVAIATPTSDAATPKPARSVADTMRLAAWCAERGHDDRAKELARDVVQVAPDHAGARALLGFVRVGDRWARARPAPDHARSLKTRVERDLRRLVAREAEARDAARDALVAVARLEDLPGLADEVARIHAEAGRFWTRRARAVVEIRATDARRVANRPWSTSLGTGTPVRFQLPELRSVRIGTTVPVPTGGG